MQKELTLTLSIDEVNIVLEALGEMPFSKVFQLIDNIQRQAAQQLQPANGQHQPAVTDPIQP